MTKRLGITVLPEWIQAEGIGPLLDNLQGRAGAHAIATSPYVLAETDEETGGREPPIDAGAGGVRLLDRPLWGKRTLHCRTAPSYAANLDRYDGLRYQPAPADDLTRAEGGKVGDFIKAAKDRGLEVWLQVQSAIPPGYRVQFGGPEADDIPSLPDGTFAQGRVDKNGSLASPHIRAYVSALLGDLAAAYPEADGFRIDWPEYPPYTLDSIFLDFSRHALEAGERLGFDMERMRAEAQLARQHLLTMLTDRDVQSLSLEAFGGLYPSLADLWRLKREIVASFLHDVRENLPPGKKLAPQAFPPPWSLVSGFDYARAAPESDAIGVKLYTMHWPMMLRFYADAILRGTPGLDSTLLARRLVTLLDTGGVERRALDALHYPEPDEPHPVGQEAQARKIALAQKAAGDCPVYPFAHGYGPLDDFTARATTAWQAGAHGIWVNRYGYLSDEKLELLRRLTSAGD